MALSLFCVSTAFAQRTVREVASGPLLFRAWPGQVRLARALADASARSPTLPGLPLDVLSDPPVIVFLPPDRATFDSLAPGAPDWAAGLAFPEGNHIVLPTFAYRDGGRLVTVLRHEVAHVAVRRYLGPSAPRWFHEGYAQLAAGSWQADQAWKLRFAILMGRLPSLESLSLDFGRRRLDAEHAYLLSYTAVEYLYRLGGDQGFARLLARWRESGQLDRALRETYGITLAQYERLWRRDVANRFGWLLVLGQTAVFWSILTILLLFLGYWKKRRNRRKLAALEAATAGAGPEEEGRASGETDDMHVPIDGEEGSE